MVSDIKLAKKWLEIAILRHERHMAGKESTAGKEGEISQKLMMEEMKYALRALYDGYVVTTSWYDENINKRNSHTKSGSMM